MREISAVTKSWGWARLLIDEETGRVVIVSDYGEWSYCWRHIGDRTLPQFLAGLNWDYMGEKMLNGNIRVPSDERTVNHIKSEIISLRKTGTLDKEEAALEWEFIDEFQRGWTDFRGWCDQTHLMEPWEYRCDEPNGQWMSFWDHIWTPLIVPALKQIGDSPRPSVQQSSVAV